MSSLDTQHHERYEQMKSDVNRRHVDWWFYLSSKKEIGEDLKGIIKILKDHLLPVGPFGQSFICDGNHGLKPEFYGIPLQFEFADGDGDLFTAFVATSADASILLKNAAEFLRSDYGYEEFRNLELNAMCVQTATDNNGNKFVVAMDLLANINPLSLYEHPPNGRFLMAMTGSDLPDQSALVMAATRRVPATHIQVALYKATALYNEYELGDIEKEQLTRALYTLFKQQESEDHGTN